MAIDAGSIVAWLELDASQYRDELTLSLESANAFAQESESVLTGVVSTARELLSGGVGQTIGAGFITGIGAGMRAQSPALTAQAASAASGATGAVASAFSGASALGARMISAVAAGIRANAGSLASAAHAAAAQAMSAFQSAIGSGSSGAKRGASALGSASAPAWSAYSAPRAASVTVNHYGDMAVRAEDDVERVAQELYGMVKGAVRGA